MVQIKQSLWFANIMFEWTNRNNNKYHQKRSPPTVSWLKLFDLHHGLQQKDAKRSFFPPVPKQILREFELRLFWSSSGVQNQKNTVNWWFGILGMPFSNNPLSFSGILSDSQTTNPPNHQHPPFVTVTCSSRSGTWIDGWRFHQMGYLGFFLTLNQVQGIFVRDTSLNQKHHHYGVNCKPPEGDLGRN